MVRHLLRGLLVFFLSVRVCDSFSRACLVERDVYVQGVTQSSCHCFLKMLEDVIESRTPYSPAYRADTESIPWPRFLKTCPDDK